LVLAGIGITVVFATLQWVRLLSHQSAPVDGVVPENGIYVHLLGVPLDDVYIHCRYAENLLHGYSFSFNPGETLTADTSPLWVLILAFAGLFTSHLELAAIGLSILAYLIIAPGVYRTTRNVFGFPETHARLAGWATVFAARLTWSAMSGMETALATLLLLLVVEEHLRSRKREFIRLREAIWLGLGLLVRPEFLFVAAVLAADWLYAILREKADGSQGMIALLFAAAIGSPAYALNLCTRNSLVSHSSVVQGAGFHFPPPPVYVLRVCEMLGSNNFPLIILFVAGLFFIFRQSPYRLLYVITIGVPLLSAFFAPQARHHVRYIFPVIPLIVIGGIASWKYLEEHYAVASWLRLSIPALIMVAAVVETARWGAIECSDVRNINDQHLAIANWLQQNMQPRDTLAVDDIGAFGYLLNKPLIDLTGLGTPAIFAMHDQDSVWKYARAHGATIFIIYKQMNPKFYERHKDSLILIHQYQVRLPHTSAAAMAKCVFRVKESHGS
jgi:hypothetical protein